MSKAKPLSARVSTAFSQLKAGRLDRAWKELSNPLPTGHFYTRNKTGDKNRVAWQIRPRVFKVEMAMDNWREAILRAEDPFRPRRYFLQELYKDALRDFHLFSQWRNRLMKTTGQPFALFQDGNEEPNWEMTKLLETNWFRKYMRYVLETISHGHSLIEFQDLKEARETVSIAQEISDVKLIRRSHVVPEEGIVLLTEWDTDGIPYREEPWNEWILEAGESNDFGILLPAVREVIWKLYSRTDWSQRSEKFGMPLLKLVTAGMSDAEIDKMEDMAKNFGSNGYVLVDDKDNAEMIESQSTDAFKIYQELCKYCDEQNSKGILGGTALSDEKSFVGSSEVQERTANDLIQDDMRMVAAHINEKLIPFLIGKGYPLNGFEFKFIALENDDEDASMEADQ